MQEGEQATPVDGADTRRIWKTDRLIQQTSLLSKDLRSGSNSVEVEDIA